MKDLIVQFKLGPEGKQPTRANEHDAGWDIYASSDAIWEDKYIAYKTDLFLSIPPGWVGHIYPRSSNSKMDLILANSVGTIDSGYLGEIGFRWKMQLVPTQRNAGHSSTWKIGGKIPQETVYLPGKQLYKKGDRIGQIVFSKVPEVSWREVTDFEETVRGTGGFGSSGV